MQYVVGPLSLGCEMHPNNYYCFSAFIVTMPDLDPDHGGSVEHARLTKQRGVDAYIFYIYPAEVQVVILADRKVEAPGLLREFLTAAAEITYDGSHKFQRAGPEGPDGASTAAVYVDVAKDDAFKSEITRALTLPIKICRILQLAGNGTMSAV